MPGHEPLNHFRHIRSGGSVLGIRRGLTVETWCRPTRDRVPSRPTNGPTTARRSPGGESAHRRASGSTQPAPASSGPRPPGRRAPRRPSRRDCHPGRRPDRVRDPASGSRRRYGRTPSAGSSTSTRTPGRRRRSSHLLRLQAQHLASHDDVAPTPGLLHHASPACGFRARVGRATWRHRRTGTGSHWRAQWRRGHATGARRTHRSSSAASSSAGGSWSSSRRPTASRTHGG